MGVREALIQVLEPVAGALPRPADLVDRLGLDKTNAWRIVRTLEAKTGNAAIHEMSAPSGLRLVLDAARAAGAAADTCDALEGAINAFADLIAEFPDGRRGLNAAVITEIDGASDTMHRGARRKVVQGLTEMLGLRAGVRYFATILAPGEIETHGDVIGIGGYGELRRVRNGPQPVVFSTQTYTQVTRAGDPRMLTLDSSDDSDPRLRLLAEFSDIDPSSLELRERGHEQRLILGSESPPINEPVGLYFGQRVANALSLTSSGERAEIVNHQPKIPADLAVYDTMVHESLFQSCDPPRTSVEWFGFNPVAQSPFPDDGSYRIDWNPATASLGKGLGRLALRELPNVRGLLRNVFDRVGQDPDEYRVYRTSFPFCVPGVSFVVWFEGDAT